MVVVVERRPQPGHERLGHDQEQLLDEEDEIEGQHVEQGRIERQLRVDRRRGAARRRPAPASGGDQAGQPQQQRPAERDRRESQRDEAAAMCHAPLLLPCPIWIIQEGAKPFDAPVPLAALSHYR
jgi:hypothetical protein